jgi:hypothetical protein
MKRSRIGGVARAESKIPKSGDTEFRTASVGHRIDGRG